jgi:hypothetical protein
MVDFASTRLRVSFAASMESRSASFEGDPSGIIPASTFGKVVSAIDDLMVATWDYAFTNTNDDRFIELRRLEAAEIVRRRDVELAIVGFQRGSLEIILDWAIIVGAAQSVLSGMVPNAMWDLTKYSFQSLSRSAKVF